MMLAIPVLDNPMVFRENEINILVIEDRILYRDIIEQMISQECGENGNIIISENNVPLSFYRNVEVIIDIFNLEFDDRKVLSRIQKEACVFSESYLERISEISEKLNRLAFDLSTEFPMPVKFKDAGDVSSLMKYLDFSVDTDELTRSEKLIEYLKLLRDYTGKTLFVFIGLRSLFSEEELELIYKSIAYEKINVLLLENHYEKSNSDYEKVIIIDNDMCIIE